MKMNHWKTNKTAGKRIGAGFLILVTAFCLTFPLGGNQGVKASETATIWPDPGILQSQTACVMDIDSGSILYGKDMDQKEYPASITKLMTALIAAEHSSMDETVTFSQEAVFGIERGSSSIARDVGEKMTMEQTMYGMLLESANECAAAIAEHVGGGDCNKFIDMMNAKAKELGCTNTHFANPHGLPNENHYTTAHDMALIAAAAYKNPVVAKIVGTKQYTIPPTNKHVDPTPLNNNHRMLNNYKGNQWLYDGCLGGKTGYTDMAGNTLVTFAKRNNMLLVVVILGAKTPGHYQDTKTLLDFCFANFKEYKISDLLNKDQVKEEGLLGKNENLVKIGDGSIVLPVNVDPSAAKCSLEKAKDTSSKEDKKKAGKITYTYNGRDVGSAELTYTEQKSKTYPFQNVAAKDGGSQRKAIKIDFRKVLLGIILVIFVLILIRIGILYWRKRRLRHPKRAKIYQQDLSKYKKIKNNDSNSKRRNGKK